MSSVIHNMFDTHCHLNFKAFKKTLPEVVSRAREAGVNHVVIPGTDVKTSKRAVEIAEAYEGIYAAVGIHPHHVYKLVTSEEVRIKHELGEIEELLTHPKVVAIGEIGIDRHVYENTVYEEYNINEHFIKMQKGLLKNQIELAKKYKKSLIIHNREAKQDVLTILNEQWDLQLAGKAVFHCCEPDEELLHFARQHKMYIGVDGDLTYYPEKQEFIKKVPLDMLVLETDSPFLLPEPLKTERKFPNEPKNIAIVAEWVAKLMKKDVEEIKKVTSENARKLFQL